MANDGAQPNDATARTQIAENLRFFADMRFKQLTLLIAATSAAGYGLAAYSSFRWWMALAAMFFTGCLWLMEVRSTLFSYANMTLAPDLWPVPKPLPFITTTLAALLIYMGCYIGWVMLVHAWGPETLSWKVGTVFGVALTIYTCVVYKSCRNYVRL